MPLSSFDLVDELWKQRVAGQFADLILVAKDGQTTAHSAVLGGTHELWRRLLEEQANEDQVTVVMPDVTVQEILDDLHHIYYDPRHGDLIVRLLGPVNPNTHYVDTEEEPSPSIKVEQAKPTCNICQESFKSNSSLRRHQKHAGHQVEFKCSLCAKTYREKSSLQYHEEYEHQKGKMRVCQVCGKSLKRRDLYSHMLVHQPEKWRFVCDKCDKKFMTNRLLVIHRAKEHGEQFVCSVCGKSYSTDSNLRSHVKNVHGNEQHPCEVCGKILTSRTYLNLHVKKHSGQGSDFVEKCCPVCGKRVRGRYYYQHVKMHDPTKWKHKCDQCNLKFQGKYKLLEHVAVVHTGVAHFECEKCGKLFQTTARRAGHKKHCQGVLEELTQFTGAQELIQIDVDQLQEHAIVSSTEEEAEKVLMSTTGSAVHILE